MNPVDGISDVRALRMLAGQERPIDPLVGDLACALRRALNHVETWRAFTPRRSSIADVSDTLAGAVHLVERIREQCGQAPNTSPNERHGGRHATPK